MIIPLRLLAVLVVALLGVSCHRQTSPAAAAVPIAPVSEIQRDNDSTARAVLATITGKEAQPAGQVFTNVKYLANTPARTFVAIMNGGYAKALGVRCAHCHVDGNFASDDKRPKRAAREMQVMHRGINQALGAMENIATPPTQNRAINCALCHRGQAIPR